MKKTIKYILLALLCIFAFAFYFALFSGYLDEKMSKDAISAVLLNITIVAMLITIL